MKLLALKKISNRHVNNLSMKLLLAMLLISIPIKSIAETVIKCIHKDGSITYSDKRCPQAINKRKKIIHFNTIKGITNHEQVIANKHNKKSEQRKKSNKEKNIQSNRENQALLCNEAKAEIEKINSQMRAGYKASEFNKYNTRLKKFMAIRNKNCK